MNNSAEHTYKGECLCGSIKYKVDEIESKMGHCHCSMCRKFHGAAFATFGEAQAKKFHWIQGKECLKTYTAPNGTKRQFCAHCGSSLIFIPSNDEGELIEFTLGTLDSPIMIKPDAHLFIGNKACWYEVSDKIPQFTKSRTNQLKT